MCEYSTPYLQVLQLNGPTHRHQRDQQLTLALALIVHQRRRLVHIQQIADGLELNVRRAEQLVFGRVIEGVVLLRGEVRPGEVAPALEPLLANRTIRRVIARCISAKT